MNISIDGTEVEHLPCHPKVKGSSKAGTQSEIDNFVQLGVSLSNGVTDTLESSSILIYFICVEVIYTQQDMFD